MKEKKNRNGKGENIWSAEEKKNREGKGGKNLSEKKKKSHTVGIVKIGPEFWTYLVSFDRCLPGD